MQVQFWGTRGSIPAPGPDTVHFGGNTSCVEVCTDAGTLVILDCGTGLRELGRHLLKTETAPIHGHIFISHTHWDHIQGFPFFGPLFSPNSHFTIYGAHHLDRTLEAALAGQMEHAYFPIRLSDLAAHITFREVEGDSVSIGDAVVRLHHVNHPIDCLAYRIEANNATVVYLTDTEPYASYVHTAHLAGSDADPSAGLGQMGIRLAHEADARLAEFARGADLLIMDAQYSVEEYRSKRGWGHSHLDHVVDFAVAAQVKRLALYHHDPEHSDAVIAAFERHCQQRAQQDRPELDVFAAREGTAIRL